MPYTPSTPPKKNYLEKESSFWFILALLWGYTVDTCSAQSDTKGSIKPKGKKKREKKKASGGDPCL